MIILSTHYAYKAYDGMLTLQHIVKKVPLNTVSY